jgi:hypothetical protein
MKALGVDFNKIKQLYNLPIFVILIKRSGSFSIFALSLSGPITTGKTLTVLQKGIWGETFGRLLLTPFISHPDLSG